MPLISLKLVLQSPWWCSQMMDKHYKSFHGSLPHIQYIPTAAIFSIASMALTRLWPWSSWLIEDVLSVKRPYWTDYCDSLCFITINVMEEDSIAAYPNGRKLLKKVIIIDVSAILTVIMINTNQLFHQVGIWCEPIFNYQYPVEVITFQIIPWHVTFIHTLQLKQMNSSQRLIDAHRNKTHFYNCINLLVSTASFLFYPFLTTQAA